MVKLAKAQASYNAFEVPLPYGLGQNYLTPHAMARGMFVLNEFSGRYHVRPEYQPNRPGLVAEYGGRSYPVQLFQVAGQRLNHRSMDLAFELMRQGIILGYTPQERVVVRFDADRMLEALGKSRGGNNRKWLADELTRLGAAKFRLVSPGLQKWEFSVINDALGDDTHRDIKVAASYEVELNARLVKVFADGWGLIDGRSWRALIAKRDHLGRMILAFFSTMFNPAPKPEAELQVMLGRDKLRHDRWLNELKASLANVQAVTGWHTCELIGEKVWVFKTEVEAKKAAAGRQSAVPQAPRLTAAKTVTPAPVATTVEDAEPTPVAVSEGDQVDLAFICSHEAFLIRALALKHPERQRLVALMGPISDWTEAQFKQVALDAWQAKTRAAVEQFIVDFMDI